MRRLNGRLLPLKLSPYQAEKRKQKRSRRWAQSGVRFLERAKKGFMSW